MLMRRNTSLPSGASETVLLISRLAFVCVLYLILQIILPFSKLPLIISTLALAGTINETTMFNEFKRRIGRFAFNSGSQKITCSKSRTQLVNTVYDITQYVNNGKKWNNRKRTLFRQMTHEQQHICMKLNYPEKLNKVESLFTENNKILEQVVSKSIKKYSITGSEMQIAEEASISKKRNNFFGVVESLCHFSRDWSLKPNGEIEPLLKYINKNIGDLDSKDTVVVVPGSGLGRVAHELSIQNFSSVQAIEYSWMMVLLNQFVYGNQSTDTPIIYPYIHTYSNHVTNQDQMRPVQLMNNLEQPRNLNIHYGDFNDFDLNEHLRSDETAKNIIIVTCFFMDTAENMLDYISSINRICDRFEGKKRWINLGPLKYGTAAKAELSYEEFKKLIELAGWNFTNEVKDPELLGYLTDTRGLWQGFYKVTMWTCEKNN